MALSLGLVAAQLNGGETGFLTKFFGGDLIRRDGVVETLPGFRVAIGTGQIEGTAPVSLVVVLIGEILNHGQVLLMAFQRGETSGEIVVGSGCLFVRIPAFFGHTPAHGKEHHSFWGRRRRGRGSEPAKSE